MQPFGMCLMLTGLSFKEEVMERVSKSTFPQLGEVGDLGLLRWSETSSSFLYKTPIFGIESHERTSSDSQSGSFIELVCRDFVTVIPAFEDENGETWFVMELQYRHGSRCVTCEYPGGIVEKDEDPMESALRELEEETGVRAHSIREIGRVCPNSAFMGNRQYVYLAKDLEFTANTHFDENEQIRCVCVRERDVLSSLGNDSLNSNGIMAIASFFYIREKSSS